MFDHHDLASDQPGVVAPAHQPDGDVKVVHTRPHNADDGNDQDDEGESHNHVQNAHQDTVQPSAIVAGDEADDTAGDKGDDHGQNADG